MTEATEKRVDSPSSAGAVEGGEWTAAEEPSVHGRSSQPVSSIALLVIIAALLWMLSLLMPGRYDGLVGRVGTLTHWLSFGKLVLGESLKAMSVVAVALAVSALVPGIGLLVRKIAFRSDRRLFLAVAAGLAVLTSGWFSYVVLEHMPHVQDEVAVDFQAKVLASGRLYAPTPELIDFFDCEFIVADGPRWYSKYFIGPSLVMVPGVWLGVPWLISPLLAGVAVLLVYALGRNLFNEELARVAALLMVISPFRVSLFSMMMAHPACLVALALFALAVIKVVRGIPDFRFPISDSPSRLVPQPASPRRLGHTDRWAAVAGVALGFSVHCRPLTALAVGGMIGLIAMWFLPWRQLRWQTAAAFILPLGVFAVLFLGYNHALTGDPLLAPFTKFSPTDRLGFGPEKGLDYLRKHDMGHSWEKALFINTYFSLDGLGQHLTGWGQISLLLLVWPVLLSRWKWRARMLAAVTGALIFAYFFYYTPSVFAGQARYWSEAMPMMMLLVAIALANARELLPRVCRVLGLLRPARTASAACWLAAVLLTVWGVWFVYMPLVAECQHFYWGQGSKLRDDVKAANLNNALVFLEAGHYRQNVVEHKWDVYASGFILNDPDLKGPVVFARDLGDERNAELIARYPGRDLYWIDLALFDQAKLYPLSEAPRQK